MHSIASLKKPTKTTSKNNMKTTFSDQQLLIYIILISIINGRIGTFC